MINLTPFLRFYASRRASFLQSMVPSVVQEKTLLSLVKKAQFTNFGKEHSFHQISSVAQYQKLVPLRTYEQFWSYYFKPVFPHVTNITWPGKIEYFPVSSGTTSGTTKYIPYSSEMIRSNTKAGLDLLVYHLLNRPKSKIFGGKSFMLGGSTDLKSEAAGIWSGDLSGISVKVLPWWAKLRYFPPQKLALISDWEKKIDLLGRHSLREDIRMISGVPSWMLIFFDKLSDLTSGRTLGEIYPNLEMVVHGGVNFSPYRERYEEILKGTKAELREVYPASEGFIGIADRGLGEGLKLNLDHGIFYEFVPVEELTSQTPVRHWIGNIEKDVNYAIVLTTCAGLWSYIIGDTVRFIDREKPKVLITGRTSYYLSAFGEHLIAEEIEDGITTAATAIGAQVKDYSVGPVFPQGALELGGHLYVIEFSRDGFIPEDKQKVFLEKLDKRLRERNEDYDAHRAKNFGLNPPKLLVMSNGGFSRWMKERGKLGGQNKVPRIITDQKLFANLQQFASAGNKSPKARANH